MIKNQKKQSTDFCIHKITHTILAIKEIFKGNFYFIGWQIRTRLYSKDLNRQFFQRRQKDGQQVPENMTNMTDHQGNANQNHSDMSPETCQMVSSKRQEIESVGEDETCVRLALLRYEQSETEPTTSLRYTYIDQILWLEMS